MKVLTTVTKIISGGQTGVDRAALEIAIKHKISHGGWCPKSRRAEDGCIPEKFQLTETASASYRERTQLNIRDSDGTLIFVPELPLTITDGTVLTIQEVNTQQKSHFIIDLSQPVDFNLIVQWILENKIKTLNVAGPRESQCRGVGEKSYQVLDKLFFF